MFQFIILGLLFLFIVLHFYTDIKNYINTGNIIEGNDEDATVPDANSAPEKCVSGNYSTENPCKKWMSKWGWCGDTDAHKNGGTDCTLEFCSSCC